MGTTTRVGYGTTPIADNAIIVSMDMDTKEFKTYSLPFTAAAVTAMAVTEDGKIWGIGYNTIFCFDPETEKIEYSENLGLKVNNRTNREFTVTVGSDGTTLFISSNITRDFYRFDTKEKKFETIAEDVGWRHVMDNYGNFYFSNETEVNKLTFIKD